DDGRGAGGGIHRAIHGPLPSLVGGAGPCRRSNGAAMGAAAGASILQPADLPGAAPSRHLPGARPRLHDRRLRGLESDFPTDRDAGAGSRHRTRVCCAVLGRLAVRSALMATPILGSLSVDADLRIEVPVVDLGGNQTARVEIAVSALEPPEASPLWRIVGAVSAP